ncbi:MAG: GntR family transcriptional regulator [Microcystaceae cyanobacterium]
MLQFQIQPKSDIPSSQQLLDQLRFAIASRQYSPGHRLPSTRQLAMITGLHRNTVSKVYQQLEEQGLVESIAGSGMYVKIQSNEGNSSQIAPLAQDYPDAHQIVQKSLDELLLQGLTLSQVQELFLAEIEWRLQCTAQVLVTVPKQDLGAGELILRELEQALAIPVQLVALEELGKVLAKTQSGTVVTSRYFIHQAEAIAKPYAVRAIALDIHDYSKELSKIKDLPPDTRLGLVSLSLGIVTISETLIHSLRGDELIVMTATVSDQEKLAAVVKYSHTIMSDSASYPLVKQAIAQVRDDIIRPPHLICCENYIGDKSINLLKRELGLGELPNL